MQKSGFEEGRRKGERIPLVVLKRNKLKNKTRKLSGS